MKDNITLRSIVEEQEQGLTSREEMIQKLIDYPHFDGQFIGDDGYKPSSWDELVELLLEGKITEAELGTIVLTYEENKKSD